MEDSKKSEDFISREKYKISIIIPYYKGEKFIAETLKSCKEQTYKNIEVIIVDDSADNMSNELDKILLEYTDVIYIKNEKNVGFNASCNVGINASKGDFITILGQDDLLLPSYYTDIYDLLSENLSFIYGNPMMIDESGNRLNHILQIDKIEKNERKFKMSIAKDNPYPSTGLIMNKKYLLNAGLYTTEYKNYGEWNLWIKLAALKKPIFVEKTYALYRRHENNMTNSFKQFNTQKVLIKYRNCCRKLVMKKFDYSLLQKAYLIGYWTVYELLQILHIIYNQIKGRC